MSKQLDELQTAELRKMAEEKEIENAEDMSREELIESLGAGSETPAETEGQGESNETPPESPEGDEDDGESDELDLEKATAKELKEEALARGIDVKGMRKRQDFIDAILKADSGDDEGSDELDVGKPEVEEPQVATQGMKESHTPIGSKAEIMKRHLAKQPKVKILIPLRDDEKMGTTTSVTLNGYRLNIMKGVYVDVPEQIADIVMDSQKQTRVALEHKTKIVGNKPELNA